MMTHMVLSDGVAYVEAPDPQDLGDCELVCDRCALVEKTDLCYEAVTSMAPLCFGADCNDRLVIYIKADPQPQKAEG